TIILLEEDSISVVKGRSIGSAKAEDHIRLRSVAKLATNFEEHLLTSSREKASNFQLHKGRTVIRSGFGEKKQTAITSSKSLGRCSTYIGDSPITCKVGIEIVEIRMEL